MEWANYVAEKKGRNSVFRGNSSGRFLHGPPLKVPGPSCSKGESANHRINLHPVDSAIVFPNTYPLDRDLSDG